MPNLSIVIRPEVSNIIILVFLIIYSSYCQRKQGKRSFTFNTFAFCSIGHNLFAIITEYTVNSETVNPIVNDACHIIFFVFSVGFTYTFFRYIMLNILPRRKARPILIISGVLFLLCVVSMFIFHISYLQGNGTKYSAGTGPTICFATGLIMFLISDIVLIINRKKLDANVLVTLLPLSIICIILLIVQILVPEFLITGSVLTIGSLGVFFAIENPVVKFENRAMIDFSTGVKNRNCYERDLEKYSEKHNAGEISAIICDINNLKETNDNYGHLEGDILIWLTSKEIRRLAAHAMGIYRFGGDEFILLYKDCKKENFESDASALQECLRSYNDRRLHNPLSVAVGSAWVNPDESIREVVMRADMNMYQIKKEMKGQA